jgi:hypothetical protein
MYAEIYPTTKAQVAAGLKIYMVGGDAGLAKISFAVDLHASKMTGYKNGKEVGDFYQPGTTAPVMQKPPDSNKADVLNIPPPPKAGSPKKENSGK